MRGQIAGMVDDPPAKTPDWLAALRYPIEDDLKPPPYIKAPQHFPRILKAFGPLNPSDLRRVVLALDEMVKRYLPARKRKPPMKFDAADKLLAPIETHLAKSLSAWERGAPLYPVIL